MTPFLLTMLTDNPVSGTNPGTPYNRLSVAPWLRNHFPTAQTASERVSSLPPRFVFQTEASKSRGLEMNPFAAVAVPVGGITTPARADSEPPKKAVPETSSMPAGLVLPIPTLPPDSKMAEFSMLQTLVNLEI